MNNELKIKNWIGGVAVLILLFFTPAISRGASADISCLDSSDKAKVEEACAKAGAEAGKQAKEENANRCTTEAINSSDSVCGKRPTCPAGQEFSLGPYCIKTGEFGNFKTNTKVTKPSKACTDGLRKVKAAENALAAAEKAVEKAGADLDKFLKDAVDKDSKVRNARRAGARAGRDLDAAKAKLEQAKSNAVKTGAIKALESVVSAASKAYSNEKGGPVKDKKYDAYTAAYNALNAAKGAAIAKSAKVGAAQAGVAAAEDKARNAEINIGVAEFDAQSKAFASARGKALQNNLKTAQERRNKAQQDLGELKDSVAGASGGSCTATVSGGKCVIKGEWFYNCVPKAGAPAKELQQRAPQEPQKIVAPVVLPPQIDTTPKGDPVGTMTGVTVPSGVTLKLENSGDYTAGEEITVTTGFSGNITVCFEEDGEEKCTGTLKIKEKEREAGTFDSDFPVEHKLEFTPMVPQPKPIVPLLQIGGGIF